MVSVPDCTEHENGRQLTKLVEGSLGFEQKVLSESNGLYFVLVQYQALS